MCTYVKSYCFAMAGVMVTCSRSMLLFCRAIDTFDCGKVTMRSIAQPASSEWVEFNVLCLLFLSSHRLWLLVAGFECLSSVLLTGKWTTTYKNSNTYQLDLRYNVVRTSQFLADMLFTLLFIMKPNKLAVAVNRLVCIGNVLGSNLVWETYCLDWCSSLLLPMTASFHVLSVSLFTRCYTVWFADNIII